MCDPALRTFVKRLQRCLAIAVTVMLAIGGFDGSAMAAGGEPVLRHDEAFDRDRQSNPAQLKMFSYVPAALSSTSAPRPLVVLLHGCGQTAADYFAPTGWRKLADEMGFVLLLPEQPTLKIDLTALLPTGSPAKCFTWREPDRGNREVRSIMNMIRRMIELTEATLDPGRIFVTGLSAGAGMTVDLAALYPTCFAGAAPIAGLPYFCAQGATEAVRTCMLAQDSPRWSPTDRRWIDRLNRACRGECPADPGSWPRISIWQGSGDKLVDPRNLEILLHQWTGIHNTGGSGEQTRLVRGSYRIDRTEFKDISERTVVETWLITGTERPAGHVVPIDPAGGCGVTQDFIADEKVCSSREIAKFFGLDGPLRPSDTAVVPCEALK